MTDLLWHYTVGRYARLILREGIIKPTDVSIDAAERPAVWLSTNQTFEPTALKGITDGKSFERTATLEEMHALCNGLYRFGVAHSPAYVKWDDFRRISGIKNKTWKTLAQVGISRGARPALEWYASFESIPARDWVAVESYDLERKIWEVAAVKVTR